MPKKASRKKPLPVLVIRRFKNQHEAEDYADSTTSRLGKKEYGIERPRGKKGVTVLTGIRRPAVVVVTPKGKIPKLPKVRITPKRPRIS